MLLNNSILFYHFIIQNQMTQDYPLISSPTWPRCSCSSCEPLCPLSSPTSSSSTPSPLLLSVTTVSFRLRFRSGKSAAGKFLPHQDQVPLLQTSPCFLQELPLHDHRHPHPLHLHLPPHPLRIHLLRVLWTLWGSRGRNVICALHLSE